MSREQLMNNDIKATQKELREQLHKKTEDSGGRLIITARGWEYIDRAEGDWGQLGPVPMPYNFPSPIPAPDKINNYLTNLLQLKSELYYLDFTDEQESGVKRPRLMNVGCDIEKLVAAVDFNTVRDPEPRIDSINKALSAGSGVVFIKPGTMYIGQSDKINIQDGTVLDFSRVKVIYTKKVGDFILSNEKENFAVTNLTVDGNKQPAYAFRSIGSRCYLVQNIATKNMDRDSVSNGFQSEDFTIRYCDLKPGRDEDGKSGTYRDQHGIVISSIPGAHSNKPALAPAPSKRFGIVYPAGFSCYSNKIKSTDGLALNLHVSHAEIMGNWTPDSAYGHKYPHSTNVMIHHNAISDNRENDKFAFRIYVANDYQHGVGHDGSQVFVFENHFKNLGKQTRIRLDVGYGEKHFINNRYSGDELPFFRVTQAENQSPPPYTGAIYHSGQDSEMMKSMTGPSTAVFEELNELIKKNDAAEMIRLMNLPKNKKWAANVDHPLPLVKGF